MSNRPSEGYAKVVRWPDIIASQDARGSSMIGNTPEEFRQIVMIEMSVWQKLVKETGINIEEWRDYINSVLVHLKQISI